MPVLQHRIEREREAGPASVGEAARAVARSVAETGRLLARRHLGQPRTWVGRTMRFADGTSSTIFWETAVVDAEPPDPAVLVVMFRLRWIGGRRWAHGVFRRTCVVNTPLFAGFPGFVTKLWLHDPETNVYRGFYEWDGAGRAAWYAERLRYVLLLVCVPGSIAYHVVPGVRRAEVFADPAMMGEDREGGTAAWWRLAGAMPTRR